VQVGQTPGLGTTGDVVAASGLAMMASGVGAAPGAAVTALGAAGGFYARTNTTVKVDSSDLTSIQSAIIRAIANKNGVSLPQVSSNYPSLENK
jgi:hypothetical protein